MKKDRVKQLMDMVLEVCTDYMVINDYDAETGLEKELNEVFGLLDKEVE